MEEDNPTATPIDLMHLQFMQLNRCITVQKRLFEMLDHGKGPRLDRGPGAREAAICLTKLQEANHWLEDARQIIRAKKEDKQ